MTITLQLDVATIRDALSGMSDAELRTLLIDVQQARTPAAPAAKPAALARPGTPAPPPPPPPPPAPVAARAEPAVKTPGKALDYSESTSVNASAVIVVPARSGKHPQFANQPVSLSGWRDVRGPKGGSYAILDIQIGPNGLIGSGAVQMSLKDFARLEAGELTDVYATLVHTDERTSIGTLGQYRPR